MKKKYYAIPGTCQIAAKGMPRLCDLIFKFRFLLYIYEVGEASRLEFYIHIRCDRY